MAKPLAATPELIDILDRIFAKGIVIENRSAGTGTRSAEDRLRFSVSSIDLLRTHVAVGGRVSFRVIRKSR